MSAFEGTPSPLQCGRHKWNPPREKRLITTRQQKLSKGVSRLTEARDVVKKLKKEAAAQEKELDKKQAEANEALQGGSSIMSSPRGHHQEATSPPWSHHATWW